MHKHLHCADFFVVRNSHNKRGMVEKGDMQCVSLYTHYKVFLIEGGHACCCLAVN